MPPPSSLWRHFEPLKDGQDIYYKGDRTHKKAWCMRCVAAYIRKRRAEEAYELVGFVGPTSPPKSDTELKQDALENVPYIKSEAGPMLHHLKECKNISPEAREVALNEYAVYHEKNRRHTALDHQPSTPSLSANPSIDSLLSESSESNVRKRTRTTKWDATLQEEFGQDTCKMFASCGFPWHAAHNPTI
ncbi:hypothetical protein OF83DRAFT_1180315 [Amylostereum chailletii]|nr:hypothetical protein OF83DRAFT_1180315 [Amylostereum chailletii]